MFSRFGHLKVTKLLLSEKGNAKCVHTKDKRSRDTSILIASQYGRLNVINLLLSKGASIEDKSRFGETAIYYASQNGHANVVELLISKGANMEEKAANNGYSPLMIAADEGHAHVVDLLVSKGAKIHDKTDNGASSLFIAAEKGHESVVELLLSKGASVHDKENDGYSPILWASQKGNVEMIKLLLYSGANLNDRTNNGRTCFALALGERTKFILRKWPITMAILVLQELALIYMIDSQSIIDIYQYLGKEDFTLDYEDSEEEEF